MNTFQPRLSPVALAMLLVSACGGGSGDSMVSASPEPYVEIPGFVDKDSIRPNVTPASTNSIQTVFQGQVKFAQSHTIDPKGNAANNMPTLVPWRDTLLMFTPQDPVNSGSIKVTAYKKRWRRTGHADDEYPGKPAC
jgi:hypothetical protein